MSRQTELLLSENAVAVRWDGVGPYWVLGRDGWVQERFTAPPDCEPVSGQEFDDKLNEAHEEGHEKGVKEGRQDGRIDAVSHVVRLIRNSPDLTPEVIEELCTVIKEEIL